MFWVCEVAIELTRLMLVSIGKKNKKRNERKQFYWQFYVDGDFFLIKRNGEDKKVRYQKHLHRKCHGSRKGEVMARVFPLVAVAANGDQAWWRCDEVVSLDLGDGGTMGYRGKWYIRCLVILLKTKSYPHTPAPKKKKKAQRKPLFPFSSIFGNSWSPVLKPSSKLKTSIILYLTKSKLLY